MGSHWSSIANVKHIKALLMAISGEHSDRERKREREREREIERGREEHCVGVKNSESV